MQTVGGIGGGDRGHKIEITALDKEGNWPPREELPFLVVSTMKVWDGLVKRGIGSTYIGPMTPLFSSPEFPPARETTTFLKWQRWDDIRMVQSIERNRLPPLEALGMEHKMNWMQYWQLQKYFSHERGNTG